MFPWHKRGINNSKNWISKTIGIGIGIAYRPNCFLHIGIGSPEFHNWCIPTLQYCGSIHCATVDIGILECVDFPFLCSWCLQQATARPLLWQLWPLLLSHMNQIDTHGRSDISERPLKCLCWSEKLAIAIPLCTLQLNIILLLSLTVCHSGSFFNLIDLEWLNIFCT